MPFTDKIVEEINTQLLAEIFSKGDFQGSKLFGIGYPQARSTSEENKFEYIVYGLDGEDFTFTDSAPVCLYHRQLQTPITPVPEQAFGRGMSYKETSQMSAVVWVKRDKIKIHESTLASWIASTLNINFPATAFSSFQLNSVSVSATNLNFDAIQIFQTEYKQPQPPFSIDEVAYFSVQYKIESTYTKGCFTTCPDC